MALIWALEGVVVGLKRAKKMLSKLMKATGEPKYNLRFTQTLMRQSTMKGFSSKRGLSIFFRWLLTPGITIRILVCFYIATQCIQV